MGINMGLRAIMIPLLYQSLYCTWFYPERVGEVHSESAKRGGVVLLGSYNTLWQINACSIQTNTMQQWTQESLTSWLCQKKQQKKKQSMTDKTIKHKNKNRLRTFMQAFYKTPLCVFELKMCFTGKNISLFL